MNLLQESTKNLASQSCGVMRRGNAHHRAKQAATRLPRQRCRRPTPRFCAAGANGTNMCQWLSARSSATAIDFYSLRGLTYHCTDKVIYI
jgi:hypothetical protein